ncbi:MAG TPA: type II CAAX endopeptidase family protein [Chthoniobacterales bacterium]|nr:type II CAAX endopeptidase family protein [Chthoniobacterales bacterium]
MNDLPTAQGPGGPAVTPKTPTWIGLFIAFFGVLIVRQAVNYFYPTLTFTAALWKESLIWICVIALLLVIRSWENLSLRSVGIGTTTWIKSLLWSVPLTIVSILVGGIIAAITHYGHSETAEAFGKLPVWLVSLICVRAGIAEELFFRGYAIERLQAMGLNRFWAAAIPLAVFSVGHWTGGWANIVIALAIGAVLSAFYLWRRDLAANMIAHFLVDFIPNVLPRFFSHSG